MKLFTAGYEGMDIEDFCKALKKHKIELITDLRKNPVSRKRGFSKRLMAENLALYGIEYLHLGGLGVPTEWRKAAKAELISRKKMFRDYVKKIIPKSQDEIVLIQKLMKKKRLALLCYESDASDCHRSFVAAEILRQQKNKLKIENLDLDAPFRAKRPQL